MPIITACAACGSRDGAYTVDEFNCHNCGRLTHADGTLVSLLDQYGPDYVEPAALGETPVPSDSITTTEVLDG